MAKKPKAERKGSPTESGRRKSFIGAMADDSKKRKAKKGGLDEKLTEEPYNPLLEFVPLSKKLLLPCAFWDSTLAKLRIKQNVRNVQARDVVSKPPPKMESFSVKKVVKKPGSIVKKYAVAHPVASEDDLNLWIPKGHEGMQLDGSGGIVPYSILGSVDEYLGEAQRQGHLVSTPVTPKPKSLQNVNNHTETKRRKYCIAKEFNQERALSCFDESKKERQKLGIFISRITKRKPQDLSMGASQKNIVLGGKINYAQSVDVWACEKRITKPVGFWKQELQLGDELRGFHISLTNTEKDHPPIRELIVTPDLSRTREIYQSGNRQNASSSVPDVNNLGVFGTTVNSSTFSDIPKANKSTKTLEQKPQINPLPMVKNKIATGPALDITGKIIRWSEDDKLVPVELGISGHPGEIIMSNLPIKNCGSCVIHYQLCKLHGEDKFNLAQHSADKLYIDDAYGIILPNDSKNICVIFRSKNPGLFSEKWRLTTTPALSQNAGIIITVWGMAKDKRVLGEDGEELVKALECNITTRMANDIISELLDRVCFERRKTNPKYKDYPKHHKHVLLTIPPANELFALTNPGLVYHSGPVSKIMEIAKLACPETPVNKWTLPLNIIRDATFTLPDPVQKGKEVIPRYEVTNKLMSHVEALSYSVQQPLSTQKTDICKKLLLDLLDDICDTACRLKKVHKITLDMDFKIELPKEDNPVPVKSQPKTPPKSPSRDVKKKKNSASMKSTSQSAPAKRPSTGANRLGRIAKGIASAKKSQYERRAKPIMYKKYLEKLNICTYLIIRNMLDRLQSYLSDY